MAEYTVTFAEQNDLDGVKIHIYTDAGRTTEVAGSPLTTAAGGGAAIDLPDAEYWFRGKEQGYADLDDDFTVDGAAKTVDFTMLRGSFDFVAAMEGDEGDTDTFAFRVLGAVDCEVDWGLGDDWEAIADGADQLVSKDFEVTGNRTIKLRGTATRMCFSGTGTTPTKLRDITSKMSDGMAGIGSTLAMFRYCTGISAFTQADWFDDTSGNVSDTSYMFADSSFNGSVSGWDTSDVTDMRFKFNTNTLFNQDISGWNVEKVTGFGFSGFFTGTTGFSVENYDKALHAWAEQNLKASLAFGGGARKYTLAGGGSKYRIMRDFGWTFTDGGIETDQAEYEITTLQELQGMGVLLDKDFKLMNDIDMTPTQTWGHTNKGFAPIGTAAAPFTGTFEAAGKLTGLTINRPATDYVGLFGNNTGTLKYAATTGTVSGRDYVGGLYGRNSGTVEDCYSEVAVTASADDKYRGGLGGFNHQGIKRRNYSTGAVLPTGGSNGGGLVGGTDTGGDYEDTANFWDTQTSGWETSVMGIGKTTAQMKTLLTFLGRRLTRAFLSAFGHGGTLTGHPSRIRHEVGGGGGANAWDIVLKADHDGEKATAIWFIDEGVDYPRLWFEYE